MSKEDCKRNLHTPRTNEDGTVVCKYCGIIKGPQPHHECQAPNCHVKIYSPDELYCQHHEGNKIFGVD